MTEFRRQSGSAGRGVGGRRVRAAAQAPARLLRWALIAAARFYQGTLSRWMGGHCRYRPTCSEYFIEAVQARGALRGTLLGLWRILRCNPFSKGGFDPVNRAAKE